MKSVLINNINGNYNGNWLGAGSDGKESACNTGDPGVTPGSERSPGEGNGYPIQYSCLENPITRGAWRATVDGIAELDTTEQLTHYVKAQYWELYICSCLILTIIQRGSRYYFYPHLTNKDTEVQAPSATYLNVIWPVNSKVDIWICICLIPKSTFLSSIGSKEHRSLCLSKSLILALPLSSSVTLSKSHKLNGS